MFRRLKTAAIVKWLQTPAGHEVIEQAVVLAVLMGALALLGGGK